jgi:pimeloyl-ACP methyl ester carboxylesterase
VNYDLPDVTDFILNETQVSSLSYIGHSEGTTQMFAFLSDNPDAAAKFNCFVGLGPAVFTSHVRGLMRLMAMLHLDTLCWNLGMRKGFMLTPNTIPRTLMALWCSMFPWTVDEVLTLLCGKLDEPMDDDTLSDWVKHEPGGTSVLNMRHWAQMVRSRGLFPKFDYGLIENLRRYGQKTPPNYDIDSFPRKLPLFLISGATDSLADAKDVTKLISRLQGCQLTTEQLPNFNHTDLVWSADAPVKVFQPVLNFVVSHKPSPPVARPNGHVNEPTTSLAHSWIETDSLRA